MCTVHIIHSLQDDSPVDSYRKFSRPPYNLQSELVNRKERKLPCSYFPRTVRDQSYWLIFAWRWRQRLMIFSVASKWQILICNQPLLNLLRDLLELTLRLNGWLTLEVSGWVSSPGGASSESASLSIWTARTSWPSNGSSLLQQLTITIFVN
jgi:hypothetical protein